MKIILRTAAVLVLFTALFAAETAEARTRIYVSIGPPPVVVERQVVAPYPDYVWQPGYYRWSNTRYVWASGRWAAPPYHHAYWVPGHWRHGRRGYYWRPGHWRR
jgi:hypothetical protein